jgi:hypothetical protein
MAVGAMLGAILIFGIGQAFVLRPQTISWILLLYSVLAADKIEKQPSSILGWIGVGLSLALWTNTHLTFVFGVLAVIAWLIDFPRTRENSKLMIQIATLLIVATLCTPHLGGEWLTLFNKIFHPYKFSYIIEFKSATIFHPGVPILIVLLILQGLFYHYRPDTIRWAKLFLVGALVFLGLTAIKFLPYALLCLSLLLAKTIALAGDLNTLGKTGAGLAGGSKNLDRLPVKDKTFYALCCASFGIAMIYIHSLTPLNTSVVPKHAVDLIERHDFPIPILNAFGAGGYLIYRFSDEQGIPRIKIPLDGRTNVNNPAIIDGFEAAMNGTPQWRTILKIVQPKTILWRTGGLFATLLLEHPDYCLVYPSRRADLAKHRYALFVSQAECQSIRQRVSAEIGGKVKITH